jgi:hypothetical protein
MSEYKKRLLELAESFREELVPWERVFKQVNDHSREINTRVDELVMLINKLENYPND